MEAPLESKPHVRYEFEVEKVIGISSDGTFQVQWAPAWVSRSHLVGCEHLIEEFLQQKSDRRVKIEPVTEPEVENLATEVEYEVEHTDLDMAQEPNSPSWQPPTRKIRVPNQGIISKTDTYPVILSVSASHVKQMDQHKLQKTYSNIVSTSVGEMAECPDQDESCVSYSGIPSQLVDKNDHSKPYVSVPDSVYEIARSYNEPETLFEQDNDLFLQNNAKLMHIHSACHSSKHTGEKHSCPHCNKTFSRSNDLTRHIRLHSGEKLFSCAQCHKSFARRDHLERHELTHTGLKPFSCIKCGKSFCKSKTLKQHLDMHSTEELMIDYDQSGILQSDKSNGKNDRPIHSEAKQCSGVIGKDKLS